MNCPFCNAHHRTKEINILNFHPEIKGALQFKCSNCEMLISIKPKMSYEVLDIFRRAEDQDEITIVNLKTQ